MNIENFVRAETDRMFAALQGEAGGVNRLGHRREPTSVEQQTVIRMNRDTLYSFGVLDISAGATLTIPDTGARYASVMVVNQDHYINRVFYDAGAHALAVEEFETPWVGVGVRVLADPADAGDVAAANALQDEFAIQAGSSTPFVMPDFETTSFDATRKAILELAKHAAGLDHAFGKRDQVDPINHLLGTAAGWGGLPERDARYTAVFPDKPVGEYSLTVEEVPVDGFWSVSVYNADGFFEPNDRNAYSVNDLTATRNDDGSVTVHFGGDDDRPNLMPITEGWNYVVRMYRPRPEILDGSWTFPALEAA